MGQPVILEAIPYLNIQNEYMPTGGKCEEQQHSLIWSCLLALQSLKHKQMYSGISASWHLAFASRPSAGTKFNFPCAHQPARVLFIQGKFVCLFVQGYILFREWCTWYNRYLQRSKWALHSLHNPRMYCRMLVKPNPVKDLYRKNLPLVIHPRPQGIHISSISRGKIQFSLCAPGCQSPFHQRKVWRGVIDIQIKFGPFFNCSSALDLSS